MKKSEKKKFVNSLLEVKGRKTLFWDKCWTVYMILYSIIMLGFAITGVSIIINFKGSSDYQLGQEILNNWSRNYILNIISVPANSNCPTDYEFWHEASWPGITLGCSCISNNGGFSKLVTPGACTALQLNSKCTTVNSMKAVPYYTWRDSVKVCILRSKYSLLTTPANCGPGYQRCGNGKVRVCVPVNTLCPVSDVIISGEYTINGYNKVVLSSTRNLFFSRNDSNFPISKFKLSEYGYCAFDDVDDITLGRRDYILSNVHRYTCSKNETRYVVLDTQGERDLYVANNLLTTAKSIPGYPIPSNDYTWNLGFVRYFTWADSCRNGPYSISHVQDKLSFDASRNVALIVLGLTILSVGISGVILPIRKLKKRILEESLNRYMERDDSHREKVLTYKKIFSSADYLMEKTFKILLFPILILGIFFIRRDYQWFLTVEDNSCADSVTYSLFDKYSDMLRTVFAVLLAELMVWVLSIFIDVLQALIIVFRSPRPKKVHVRIYHHKDGREDEVLQEVVEDSRSLTPASFHSDHNNEMSVKYRKTSHHNESHSGHEVDNA